MLYVELPLEQAAAMRAIWRPAALLPWALLVVWTSSYPSSSPFGAEAWQASLPGFGIHARRAEASRLRARSTPLLVVSAAGAQGGANDAVKRRLAELERLRVNLQKKKGLGEADATAAVSRQLADDAAAKKQQAKELNKKLDDMMETARVENEKRQTRAQAKRRATLAGIAAVSQKHTKEFRDMQEMRRNTETVDAALGLRRGTGAAFASPQSLWDKLPRELTATFRFLGVLGRGSYGVVVLAEKRPHADVRGLTPAGLAGWQQNCDITGQSLQCDSGASLVAVKMLVPQSSLPGVFVVLLPWLYCPIMWCKPPR